MRPESSFLQTLLLPTIKLRNQQILFYFFIFRGVVAVVSFLVKYTYAYINIHVELFNFFFFLFFVNIFR